jgi:hypothetical protein
LRRALEGMRASLATLKREYPFELPPEATEA